MGTDDQSEQPESVAKPAWPDPSKPSRGYNPGGGPPVQYQPEPPSYGYPAQVPQSFPPRARRPIGLLVAVVVTALLVVAVVVLIWLVGR